MSKSTDEMKKQLDKFNEEKPSITSPTHALMDEEVSEKEVTDPKPKSKLKDKSKKKLKEKNEEIEKDNDKPMEISDLSNLFTSKPRMEDTHTRRTFLVKNELLKRLDNRTNKPKDFTNTKFINYLIELGLNQLEGED